MLFWNYGRAIVALASALPLARTQFVSSLPDCVQACINQSQDDNCSAADIACLCRASAGNFLPDVITCIHAQCDNDLDNDLLLTPLQWACDLAGAPIPTSAIHNAENQASTLAAQATTTVATTGGAAATTTNPNAGCASGSLACPASVGGGCCPSGYACGTASCTLAPSTTTQAGSVTITTVTTTQSGTVIAVAFPVTEWSTTTATGSPSTVATVSTETTIAVGQVITTTNSAGSTFTTTQRPSSTSSSSSGSASSDSVTSSTTVTTSIAAESTSSSGTQTLSKTSAASNPDATDSAPFKNSNGAAGRTQIGNWLGLIILLAVGVVLV